MWDIVRWVGWNTLLAAIPVALGYAILGLSQREGKRPRFLYHGVQLLLLGAWFAFLPNTCYLLTEWRHFLDELFNTNLYAQWHLDRDGDAMVQLLLQTLFYATYSAIGVLTFALAIRPVHRLARRHLRRLWVWKALLFGAIALGVYLGLVARFNSWDLITRPEAVWASIRGAITHPKISLVIGAFALFLWGVYFATDTWIDGLLLRWRQAGRRQEE